MPWILLSREAYSILGVQSFVLFGSWGQELHHISVVLYPRGWPRALSFSGGRADSESPRVFTLSHIVVVPCSPIMIPELDPHMPAYQNKDNALSDRTVQGMDYLHRSLRQGARRLLGGGGGFSLSDVHFCDATDCSLPDSSVPGISLDKIISLLNILPYAPKVPPNPSLSNKRDRKSDTSAPIPWDKGRGKGFGTFSQDRVCLQGTKIPLIQFQLSVCVSEAPRLRNHS